MVSEKKNNFVTGFKRGPILKSLNKSFPHTISDLNDFFVSWFGLVKDVQKTAFQVIKSISRGYRVFQKFANLQEVRTFRMQYLSHFSFKFNDLGTPGSVYSLAFTFIIRAIPPKWLGEKLFRILCLKHDFFFVASSFLPILCFWSKAAFLTFPKSFGWRSSSYWKCVIFRFEVEHVWRCFRDVLIWK